MKKTEIAKGLFLALPEPGEKFGIDNIKIIARLSARAAILAAEIAADGRLSILEAFGIYSFIKKGIKGIKEIAFADVLAEVRDLSPEEMIALADVIKEETGAKVAGAEAVVVVSSFIEALVASSTFLVAAKRFKQK